MNLSESDIRNFWSKVDKDDDDKCWLWNSGCDSYGYGATFINGKAVKAHRVSFFLAYGYLPTDVHHDKDCSTRCCNPNHLHGMAHGEHMALTHQLGQVDYSKIKRASGDQNGRRLHPENYPSGEKSSNAKLTDQQVKELREQRGLGASLGNLAKRFGIGKTQVSRIAKGQSRVQK